RLQLPLSCHRQKRSHDACATVGGGAYPFGALRNGRIACGFLEQGNLAGNNRKRVVQLMRDTGEERAEHRHLLASVEGVTLMLEFLLRPLALGDVADRSDQPFGLAFGVDGDAANSQPPERTTA